jgi:hypothetical protein
LGSVWSTLYHHARSIKVVFITGAMDVRVCTEKAIKAQSWRKTVIEFVERKEETEKIASYIYTQI